LAKIKGYIFRFYSCKVSTTCFQSKY